MTSEPESREPQNPPGPPAAPRKSRVLLVDDHPIFLEGLTAVINGEADLEVCGSAGNAPDALEAVAKLHPDIAIIDISLEGSHGIDLVKDLAVRHPRLPTFVLSMHDESLYAERALRAGAKGYAMKRAPRQELLGGVRDVLQGHFAFSANLLTRIVEKLSPAGFAAGSSPTERLNDRELQVLELLGKGLSNAAIAAVLGISSKTVTAYRTRMKQKLGINDTLGLIRFAVTWAESGKQVGGG